MTMKAMVINRLCRVADAEAPLQLTELPVPEPGPGEIRIRVTACGVCHTELDIIEGRTPPPKLPVVPGHQVVGRVDATGPDTGRFKIGDRVGVAWIFSACGKCDRCLEGRENLCDDFTATGRDVNGGYAEYMRVPEDFAHSIPNNIEDAAAAPLLCAGAVGYRSLRLTGMGENGCLGFTGFGASAHLVLKLVRQHYPGIRSFVFARSGDQQQFAMDLGAHWAGDFSDSPPELLDSIIDTTPVWKPVKRALEVLKPGGCLVINAIRKEAVDQSVLGGLDYAEHLWMEKEIKSVANITRQDVGDFLRAAASTRLRPEVQLYPLEAANTALKELVSRRIRGAKVLTLD